MLPNGLVMDTGSTGQAAVCEGQQAGMVDDYGSLVGTPPPSPLMSSLREATVECVCSGSWCRCPSKLPSLSGTLFVPTSRAALSLPPIVTAPVLPPAPGVGPGWKLTPCLALGHRPSVGEKYLGKIFRGLFIRYLEWA